MEVKKSVTFTREECEEILNNAFKAEAAKELGNTTEAQQFNIDSSVVFYSRVTVEIVNKKKEIKQNEQ